MILIKPRKSDLGELRIEILSNQKMEKGKSLVGNMLFLASWNVDSAVQICPEEHGTVTPNIIRSFGNA